MEFLTDYGLFLAKTVTVVIALAVVLGLLASVSGWQKKQPKGHIEVTCLNDNLKKMTNELRQLLLPPDELKKQRKAEKKEEKKQQRQAKTEGGAAAKRRVFVLDFKGDIRASAVTSLREEVTAVLSQARVEDEVVVKLESAGGMVHSYGLASSQLDRVGKENIPLTVCVDKVAASGGYMMACVADKILAAPFAVLGSIGVVAQLPNFHRLLKKHDVDYEMLTAGEYKRTLTVFGENTDKGREKFIEDLEDTHAMFKEFVQRHRPDVHIGTVATGEVWLGERAVTKGLVDELSTSDEYLVRCAEEADVYEVKYVLRKTLQEKVGMAAESTAEGMVEKVMEKLRQTRFFS